MANEKIIEKKQEEVQKLAEKIKNAKFVLLADYRGINVHDVTELRTALRNVESEYRVIKNNIIKRALHEVGIEELDSCLVGPTAIVIDNADYSAPAKAIYKYSKDNEFYKIKGGILEGKVISAEEIIELAKLPSREELLAKLAGGLLGTITKLAVGLDQVVKQKESVA